MTDAVKVTDSMGDHWVYDGVSIYPSHGGGCTVPALWDYPKVDVATTFPTLDAAVDAIRTHLKEGA